MPARRANPAPPTNLLLCEQCGYSIQAPDQPTHQPNCPECGKPTAESLPDRRTGTPLTPHATWSASAWALLRTPNAVYARVAIDTKASGKFFWRTMLMTLLVFACAIGLIILPLYGSELVPRGADRSSNLSRLIFACLTWFILFCNGAGLGFLLLLALTAIERLGLRTISRAHGYRITPTIAKVITDYASIGWFIGSALLIVSLLTWFAPPLMREMGRRPPLLLSPDVVLWYPVAAAFTGLLVFEALAYIGLQRCKFANTPRIAQ